MFLRILLLLFFLDASNAFPTTINFTQWDCYDSTPYKPNSTLETNFNLLISSLVSQIKTTKHGFLTRKEGSFYGLTMCRGDLSLDDCHDCVKMASAVVRYGCSRATQAIVWMEPCMIRYSNYSFYNLFQQQPLKTLANRDNVTDPQNWLQTLQDTLRKVTFKAANSNESGIKYATTEVWYPPMSKYLYTLAQCIPDLTNQNCSQCLTSAISQISSDLARGGIVLLPSCNLRFEVYQFYTIFATPTTSASPPAVNATLVLHGEKKKKLATKIVVPIIVVAAALMIIGLCACVFRRKAKKKYPSEDVKNVLGDLTTAESLMFQLGTLEASTNNFSDDQKLGQGGFGSVYKGTLTNGQEIAVKRLSKISGQGVEEFKNEVVLIANLQHRNLVKLLGFCLAGEEKLLVYEFVPNKSLNYFLFDEAKKKELNWPMRYDIIKGIARGLLYLHEDSRPRIIHRDLKTGNILLDANMNPKISDFGLARIFKVEQTEDDTSRVVGTYGYMAPEYAMHGQFSIKSDIYSFGVLVLEIISGKKISTKFFSSGAGDLLTHAWRSLTEGKGLELMDPTLKESYASAQVLRCIEIGLWCAQENTNARPTMSTIVLMLNSDFTTTTIPTPQCPRTFYNSSTDSSLMSRLSRHSNTTASTNHDLMPHSENEETITDIHPR